MHLVAACCNTAARTLSLGVGEEDESSISLDGLPPFRVGQLVAPPELEPLIVRLRDRMDSLNAGLTAKAEYAHLAAFIDSSSSSAAVDPSIPAAIAAYRQQFGVC